MNILVTGIGGDIGSGVGRILRQVEFVSSLIGSDIHTEHFGHRIFDKCLSLPPVSSPNYLAELQRVKDSFEIDAIIPTSEPELRFFTSLGQRGGVSTLPLVQANFQSRIIGFDKLLTAKFLSEIDVTSPWTVLASVELPKKFPCILKSRVGAGNQAVYKISDLHQAERFQKLFPQFIWQEYIPGENKEYTCGVFGCASGEIRTIIFRRRLASGVTSYAEVIEHQGIKSLCEDVAKGLNLRGSINIQLRLSDRGPMIFEINPRFSSTVVFRHKLGFTDLVWSIQEQLMNIATTYKSDNSPIGSKLYRSFDEVIE